MVIEYVYLIGQPGTCIAKIGKAVDPHRRLAEIQRMCPVPLALLWWGNGGHPLETALHRHFAEQRRHGEWFEFDGDPVEAVTTVISSGLLEVPQRVMGPARKPNMPSHRSLQVAKDLRTRIERGEFPPGTKLPSVRDLMAQYSEASIIVSMAIRALHDAGVVTHVRMGGGATVNDPPVTA